MLVGSYPTVSPITCAPGKQLSLRAESHRLVCFLLHLSSGHPAWLLASPLPCGVRTFLSPRLSQIRTSFLRFEPEIIGASNRPTHSKEPLVV